MISIEHLPGGELIQRGLADYAAGRVTPESCLLAVGWSRLQRNGLALPAKSPSRFPDPEIQLYNLLRAEAGDAYSRYNSLIRRFISFEQSLEHHHASQPQSAPAIQ
jgi:hypothetical protein